MKIQSNPDWDQDGNCRVQKALAWWSRFAPCLFSQECLIYSQIIDSNVDDVLTPTFTPFIWIYSVKKTITSDDIYCESKARQNSSIQTMTRRRKVGTKQHYVKQNKQTQLKETE